MYIQLTDKVKIKNPLDNSDIFSYEGPIEDVDLLQQKTNYLKLQDIFAEYDMQLSYIWFAKFSRYDSSTYHFVARTEEGNVFWRKYEGKSSGSGQNYIYVNGIKFKLTEILSMEKEDRDEIFL
jgi:hypothetical protein